MTTTRPAALLGGNSCNANIPVLIIETKPASAVAVMIPEEASGGFPKQHYEEKLTIQFPITELIRRKDEHSWVGGKTGWLS